MINSIVQNIDSTVYRNLFFPSQFIAQSPFLTSVMITRMYIYKTMHNIQSVQVNVMARQWWLVVHFQKHTAIDVQKSGNFISLNLTGPSFLHFCDWKRLFFIHCLEVMRQESVSLHLQKRMNGLFKIIDWFSIYALILQKQSISPLSRSNILLVL